MDLSSRDFSPPTLKPPETPLFSMGGIFLLFLTALNQWMHPTLCHCFRLTCYSEESYQMNDPTYLAFRLNVTADGLGNLFSLCVP